MIGESAFVRKYFPVLSSRIMTESAIKRFAQLWREKRAGIHRS